MITRHRCKEDFKMAPPPTTVTTREAPCGNWPTPRTGGCSHRCCLKPLSVGGDLLSKEHSVTAHWCGVYNSHVPHLSALEPHITLSPRWKPAHLRWVPAVSAHFPGHCLPRVLSGSLPCGGGHGLPSSLESAETPSSGLALC